MWEQTDNCDGQSEWPQNTALNHPCLLLVGGLNGKCGRAVGSDKTTSHRNTHQNRKFDLINYCRSEKKPKSARTCRKLSSVVFPCGMGVDQRPSEEKDPHSNNDSKCFLHTYTTIFLREPRHFLNASLHAISGIFCYLASWRKARARSINRKMRENEPSSYSVPSLFTKQMKW